MKPLCKKRFLRNLRLNINSLLFKLFSNSYNLITRNKKSGGKKKNVRSYLFILSPPFSGSTVIYKLISTSPNVSTLLNNDNWVGEGQHLLERNGILNYQENKWDPNYNLDLNNVKKIWDKYWDLKKPILCDKSPPSICRALKIEDFFSQYGKVYFICNIRNPYACRTDAKDWVRYARFQKENIESLNNVLTINYEDLCDNLRENSDKIIRFLPQLKKLDIFCTSVPGLIKGRRSKPIKKVNQFKDVEEKNKVLKNHIDLMNYFGYEFIK
ncbi:hypothetical protein KY321_02995 [Candidatus Woesearchaeota archaeon]|nr:hypothetical protein [Candidatus Woesearchaeota archaeon]